MSDPSIFDSNSGSTTPNTPAGSSTPAAPQGNDVLATLLGSIKNETGEPKYKTVEDGLKALNHSQTFITQLQSELQAARAEAAKLKVEADRVAEIERSVQELMNGKSQPAGATTPPTVDAASIAAMVEQHLSASQLKAKRDSNLSTVVTALQEKFGSEAPKKFYDKAQELGFSNAEINDLAAKSPSAVLQLFGFNVNQKQPNAAPNTSTVNTTNFEGNPSSFIGANKKSALIGATTRELMEENANARKMVDELHAQGKSVHDLTDPKVYFATFKRG